MFMTNYVIITCVQYSLNLTQWIIIDISIKYVGNQWIKYEILNLANLYYAI